MTVTIDDIRAAADTIAGHVVRTPVVSAPPWMQLAMAALLLDRGAWTAFC